MDETKNKKLLNQILETFASSQPHVAMTLVLVLKVPSTVLKSDMFPVSTFPHLGDKELCLLKSNLFVAKVSQGALLMSCVIPVLTAQPKRR